MVKIQSFEKSHSLSRQNWLHQEQCGVLAGRVNDAAFLCSPVTYTQELNVIIPSPAGSVCSTTVTEDEKRFSADCITKIFFPSAKNDLEKHKCEICLKSFKRASSLSNHRLIHNNSKAFKCDQCNMSFLRKSDLGKHVVIHSGNKPYGCSTCGKRFSQSSNMLTHQRRHSGIRPYSCTFCGKSFYRKVDVRRHCSVHRSL